MPPRLGRPADLLRGPIPSTRATLRFPRGGATTRRRLRVPEWPAPAIAALLVPGPRSLADQLRPSVRPVVRLRVLAHADSWIRGTTRPASPTLRHRPPGRQA